MNFRGSTFEKGPPPSLGLIPHARGCRPLAWGIEYTVSQCTDTPNFIFVIKQGGWGKTLEVYNSLLAQLA